MNAYAKRVAVLTVSVVVFVTGLYGIALAHTPHVPAVQVTWSAWHLTGLVNGVTHSSGSDTYSSYSKASWSHVHSFFAKSEWLDWHGLFWDTHGVKTASGFAEFIRTSVNSFTAQACRDYKFIGDFRNDGHGSGEQRIDQAQGVIPFRAGSEC